MLVQIYSPYFKRRSHTAADTEALDLQVKANTYIAVKRTNKLHVNIFYI